MSNPGNVSGVRWGSGTLIAADLVLTCGHLFDQDPNGWTVPRQNGTSNAITPAEVATNMHINVLYQVDPSGTLRTEVSFPITELVEYRLGGLDMAIVRVGGNPGTTYGWTAVGSNPAVGDMLAIIGHPAGQPKRIEAGAATTVTATQVRYADIDTLGGNSGSGILQASTGEVVGVHTNGGCTPTGGSNSGVAISAIVAVSPTLQALPHGSKTAVADDVFTLLAADVGGTIKALDTGSSDPIFTLHAADSHTIADVVGTLKAADSHTIADVIGTLKAADTHTIADVVGTLKAADTLLAADTGFAADTGYASDTLAAADTGWRDQPHTVVAGDVVGTVSAGDLPYSRVETIDPGLLDPGVVDPGVLDPGVLGGIDPGVLVGARPFVQAGPSIPMGETVDPAQTLLAELEQALLTARAVVASLEAVYAALTQSEA